jgi:hypothetical protein
MLRQTCPREIDSAHATNNAARVAKRASSPRLAELFETKPINATLLLASASAAASGGKSKRIGRPRTAPESVELIVRMASDDPRWSRRRIAQELANLGFRVDRRPGLRSSEANVHDVGVSLNHRS